MAFLAPLLGVISTGVGIATGIKALTSKNKGSSAQQAAPQPQPLPEQPKQEDAAAKAKEDMAKRRRISVLSGGNTNVTRGKALTTESDVGKKALLGA